MLHIAVYSFFDFKPYFSSFSAIFPLKPFTVPSLDDVEPSDDSFNMSDISLSEYGMMWNSSYPIASSSPLFDLVYLKIFYKFLQFSRFYSTKFDICSVWESYNSRIVAASWDDSTDGAPFILDERNKWIRMTTKVIHRLRRWSWTLTVVAAMSPNKTTKTKLFHILESWWIVNSSKCFTVIASVSTATFIPFGTVAKTIGPRLYWILNNTRLLEMFAIFAKFE